MLSQRTVQLWEGCSSRTAPFRESHVESKRSGSLREWKALCVQRRRRVRVSAGPKSGRAVVRSQGIHAAPVAPDERSSQGFVRATNGGASQLRLDGDDVRIASRDATGDGHEGGETATPSLVTRLARVSLRPPAPLPEGITPDVSSPTSHTSEDTIPSDPTSPSSAQDVASTGAEEVAALPSLQGKGMQSSTSFERFARARAAGKELVQRNKEAAALGSASEDGVYYKPQTGDYVLGVVASGNFSKLDVDIGAGKLGYLLRKDVMPLDNCSVRAMSWAFPDGAVDPPPHGLCFVRDEEALSLAMEAPMAVAVGTVLIMEVKGITPSGRALLSARSVAREYAWQRVRQVPCPLLPFGGQFWCNILVAVLYQQSQDAFEVRHDSGR